MKTPSLFTFLVIYTSIVATPLSFAATDNNFTLEEPLSTSQLSATPQTQKTEPSAPPPAERSATLSNPQLEQYTTKTFTNDINTIKWDAMGTFAGITALGIKSWKWGNTGFHFHSEKWFEKDRSSIGMDKLGHMTNLFAEHLQRKGRTPAQAALSAALLTQALMLYVETFDGFSTDHGFAYEDVIMNLAGTSLAYARQRYPKLKDLVDYRMEYSPSGYKGDGIKGFRPVSDYAGQKYLLVLKLSGIRALKETPLKYVELNAGYYARGFTTQEQALGMQRTRTAFVGVGLNLSQLLLGDRDQNESWGETTGRDFFEHIQLPTYATTHKQNF